jgi:hypothetical protein
MKLSLKASRRALDDAKKALDLFKRPDMDFQLAWVLNVAFLGIIPDVLMKVDKGASDPEAAKVIKKVWEKNNGLICDAKGIRNMVLHSYKELYEGEDVYTHDVFEEGIYEARRYKRPDFGKDRHPANVVTELVTSWEGILDEIEAGARSASG